MLTCENFYAQKHHINKVLPSGARSSSNCAPPCRVYYYCMMHSTRCSIATVSWLSVLLLQY